MKVKEATLLILPDIGSDSAEHWQMRWMQKLSTAQYIPAIKKNAIYDFSVWLNNIQSAISAAPNPVIFIAHSLGVLAAIQASINMPEKTKIKGGFFVAPPSLKKLDTINKTKNLPPYPEEKLPFPSLVISSENDKFAIFQDIKNLSQKWGSLHINAGNSQHLAADTGHGPWPEGLLIFSNFLSKL